MMPRQVEIGKTDSDVESQKGAYLDRSSKTMRHEPICDLTAIEAVNVHANLNELHHELYVPPSRRHQRLGSLSPALLIQAIQL